MAGVICSRFIRYAKLHGLLNLEEETALGNAPARVPGATRSTIVNLFHMWPLVYGAIEHAPSKIAWGHATCNTRLGQRRCHPLQELQQQGEKVGLIRADGIETIGWISTDWETIRPPDGSVWIRLCGDSAEPDALSEPGEDEPER